MIDNVFHTIEAAVLIYFAVSAVFQITLMASAAIELKKVLRSRGLVGTHDALRSSFSPSVSVLVPAFDEEAMIATTVESMLAIEYPGVEVVVVNDGSRDDTLGRLQSRFELIPEPPVHANALALRPVRALYRSRTHPRLIVIDKEQGGKADALNIGLVHATSRLVCAVDADTIIEPDAIERLVEPFLQDRSLLAAGGSVRPANGCQLRYGRIVARHRPDNLLARIQTVEYARAFLFGRLGWNRLGGNIIISGAFGLFDRDAVIETGGYLEATVGEDMELVLRLRSRAIEQAQPSRVSFVPEPMAWTEVPESTQTLGRQRNRWQRGLLDTLWRHRRLAGRPRYGLMGVLVLPYYLLEAVAPIFELAGLGLAILGTASGRAHPATVAAFFVLAYGVSAAVSAVAVGFEDNLDARHPLHGGRAGRLRDLLHEQLWYRQFTLIWRLWGLLSWLRGDKKWGAQVRRGMVVSSRPQKALVPAGTLSPVDRGTGRIQSSHADPPD